MRSALAWRPKRTADSGKLHVVDASPSIASRDAIILAIDCFSGKSLFSRLPIEVLFVCLCVRLGGVNYAIAMVRRSVERVKLHRA